VSPILSNEAVFELSVDYIQSDQPDLLDLYKLSDRDYGIKIKEKESSGGRLAEAELSWSPILKYRHDLFGTVYSPVTQGITYYVYLGFEEADLKTMSSLCKLHEQGDNLEHLDGQVEEGPGGGRRLQRQGSRKERGGRVDERKGLKSRERKKIKVL